MSDRVTYEFAIIRLVPKVERGEFMNIGVILFSKRKAYLDMKIHLDVDRIKSFSNNVDIDEVKNYLEAWHKVCSGGGEAGRIGTLSLPERLRWLTATRSTIIQSSEVHPGVTENPESELEDLFRRLVILED